jgi:cytochrome c biogenesis protein CcmG/thiol:disulfide interchange protein DsbE
MLPVLARLLLPCLGLMLALPAAGLAADPRQEGATAVPNWSLRCADGSQIDFYEALKKGPVLVSFWALWCQPCLKELPHLNSLAAETEGRLTVLAINMDSSKSVAKVRPFLSSKRYKVTVPLDTAGDVGRLLQVGGVIPFLVLYDANGREVYRHVGYKEGDEVELQKRVNALIPAPETRGEE